MKKNPNYFISTRFFCHFSIGGSSKRHYKAVECWGADKPFANITENNLTAKSIALTVRLF
jgi:hypothetical protein